MSLIIPNGFGQAVLEFDYVTGPSNPLMIVFGYSNAGDQSAFANATIINDEYESNVLPVSPIANNLMLLRTSVLQNPGGISAVVASGNVGGGANVAIPPNNAYLIRKGSATGGREGRGRIYQPGCTSGFTGEGGELLAGAAATLTNAWTEFNDNLDSNSIPMVILHTSAGTAPSLVTSLSCDALIATQRRRLRG